MWNARFFNSLVKLDGLLALSPHLCNGAWSWVVAALFWTHAFQFPSVLTTTLYFLCPFVWIWSSSVVHMACSDPGSICICYVPSIWSVQWQGDLVACWDTSPAPRGMLYIMRCQEPTMKSWHHQMRRNFWKGQILRFILSTFLIICCFIWQVDGYSARRVAEMGMIQWVWAQEPEYLCANPSYAIW